MTACRPKANNHDNGQHSIFVQYFEHLLCELRNVVYTCVKTIVCKCIHLLRSAKHILTLDMVVNQSNILGLENMFII